MAVGARRAGGGGGKPAANGPLVVVKGGQRWYDLPEVDAAGAADGPAKEVGGGAGAAALRQRADELLRRDAQLAQSSSGGAAFLHSMLRRGTRPDRHAAVMVAVQERPVHAATELLGQLVQGMAGRNRKEAFAALDTLKDTFVTYLLPPDRKLVAFDQRPLAALDGVKNAERDRKLILWYFEDRLKEIYKAFVAGMERLSHDTIESNRLKCARAMCDLLSAHPEQEAALLAAVVNKLGDGSSKLASHVCNAMNKVLEQHPNMRPVFVRKLEELIYRPNVPRGAQFYACHFLSQLLLRVGEADLALNMLSIYLNLFRVLVCREETESKLVGILLAGAARAYPYAKNHPAARDALDKQLDSLYKVAATAGSLSTGVHTLQLLYRMQEDAPTDRLYTSLYRTLNDDRLPTCSKAAAFLSLLSKAVRGDAVQSRARTFARRCLGVATRCESNVAAALIRLVHEWVVDRPGLMVLAQAKRSEAVAKRGSDVGDVKPSVSELTTGKLPADSDEEEERYEDVLEDGDDMKPDVKNGHDEVGGAGGKKPQRWVHRDNTKKRRPDCAGGEYDTAQRNPLFARGDKSPLYELLALCHHYHPTVRLYARSLLQCGPPESSGDPLTDLSAMRFLDRFVYRNPRAAADNKRRKRKKVGGGAQEGEEAGGRPATVAKIVSRKHRMADRGGVKSLPVTSADYLQRATESVPSDERYLHRFLTSFGPKAKGGDKREGETEGDNESVDSDEFDAIVGELRPGAANDAFDLDFAAAVGTGVRASAVGGGGGGKKSRKRRRDHDEEEDDGGDSAASGDADGDGDALAELDDMMGRSKAKSAKHERYLRKQEGGNVHWRKEKAKFRKRKFGGNKRRK